MIRIFFLVLVFVSLQADAGFAPSLVKNYNVFAGEDTQHYFETVCPELVPGTATYGAAIARSEAVATGYTSGGYSFSHWTAPAWYSVSCVSNSYREGRGFIATKSGSSDRNRLVYVIATCTSGSTWNLTTKSCDKANSCPEHSVLNSSSGLCECSSGYTEDAGTCVPSSSECTQTGAVGPPAYFDYGTDPQNPALALGGGLCAPNGCYAEFSGSSPRGESLVNGVRHYFAYGQMWWAGDGATCVPGSGNAAPASSASVPSSTCTSGNFPATVNGVTKCYSPAGTMVAETPPESTPPCEITTTNSTVTNGDGSKTVTHTAVDSCTNQKIVTTDNYASGVTPPSTPDQSTSPSPFAPGAGSQGTGTSGTNPTYTKQAQPGEDMTAFCEQNPTANACKTTSDQEEYCELNPDAASCAELGTTNEDPVLETRAVGPDSLTPVALAGSSSCPADVPLPRGMSFSYGPICTFAQGLYPIIVAMAWLTAGLIVIGAKSGDT